MRVGVVLRKLNSGLQGGLRLVCEVKIESHRSSARQLRSLFYKSISDEFCRRCLHHPESSRTPKFPFSFSLFRLRRFPRTHRPPPPHARTKACYQLVLQLQHVCARHLPACPPRHLLKRQFQQRHSPSPLSFPSLRTMPRHGRRTNTLVRRANQVRASNRPSWSCSQTLSARWSL